MLEDQLSAKHKKRRERKRRLWIVAGAIVVVLAVIGIFWFMLRSPFWQIRAVAVRGNSTVAAADIEDMIRGGILAGHSFWPSLMGANDILTWPSGMLPASETALIPQLAAVSVAKNYFTRSIAVNVTERQSFAIWCEMPGDGAGAAAAATAAAGGDSPAVALLANEQCFWFDASGTIFEKAYDTQGSALFAVHDYSQTSLTLGQKILPDVFISNFISILQVLKVSGLTIKEVALKDLNLQEIDVSTYDGPAVYFSLRFDADEDLPVLQSLMAKPGFKKLQYVDFRVENRAYYQ